MQKQQQHRTLSMAIHSSLNRIGPCCRCCCCCHDICFKHALRTNNPNDGYILTLVSSVGHREWALLLRAVNSQFCHWTGTNIRTRQKQQLQISGDGSCEFAQSGRSAIFIRAQNDDDGAPHMDSASKSDGISPNCLVHQSECFI